MDKSMLMGIVLGVGGAMAGGALASYAVWHVEKEPRAQVAVQQPLMQNQQAQAPSLLETPVGYQPINPAVQGSSMQLAAPLAQTATLEPQFARVLDVDPVYKTSRTPKQQCHYEQVVHRKPVKDEHRITGTVVGGVLGGVIGNQIGKGRGRDVARVAGALVGGYAGNRVQKNIQEKNTYTTTEQRCSTVTRTSKKTIGYDVTYRWNGETKTVRMNKRPGDRLPVQNGEVLLVSAQNLARYD